MMWCRPTDGTHRDGVHQDQTSRSTPCVDASPGISAQYVETYNYSDFYGSSEAAERLSTIFRYIAVSWTVWRRLTSV